MDNLRLSVLIKRVLKKKCVIALKPIQRKQTERNISRQLDLNWLRVFYPLVHSAMQKLPLCIPYSANTPWICPQISRHILIGHLFSNAFYPNLFIFLQMVLLDRGLILLFTYVLSIYGRSPKRLLANVHSSHCHTRSHVCLLVYQPRQGRQFNSGTLNF